MKRIYSLVALVAALSGRVFAQAVIGPVANLFIDNRPVSPDGFSREAVLAGDTFPGPLIRGTKGDGFAINVTDRLTDETMDVVTSIHWHGLFQRRTNYADGGAFVNQCPIVPNKSFNYRFRGEEQTGTYWYHSHFQAQYCDGLRGALVIYDPNDPHKALYDVDDENTVITLADWYHYSSHLAPLAPEPNSTLINGKGRYPGGPSVDLAVVNVDPGRRYRLRLVSISCDPNFQFSIDGHQLTVIEVDGINVRPLVVDSVHIFAGQRYSAVLNANQPIGDYWIRAVPNLGEQGFEGSTNLAILRYSNLQLPDPTQNIPQSVLPLKETDLHPLVPDPVPGSPYPGGADININFAIELNLTSDPIAFYINNATFTSPTVPVLLQILSGTRNASDLLPKGSIFGLEGNKSVELSIPAGALGGPHPIHLHGHAFHVVRSAGNSTYNYVDPVVRDVVSIGDDGDNVTIRFFTDNPGPWFLHCHIDWHLERGFAVVFAEDVPEIESVVKPTADWDQLCPTYNDFENITTSAERK
ncbi:laccase [Russula brevipes]|nr:laccase [Russula brevipes]